VKHKYGILIGKPQRKKPIGRPWSRSEDNIRVDFRETGCVN
jgi:hypothetical protein